jgi:hypothetical protein
MKNKQYNQSKSSCLYEDIVSSKLRQSGYTIEIPGSMVVPIDFYWPDYGDIKKHIGLVLTDVL